MLLVVDASVLVAELARVRGRRLLRHRELELYITDRISSEVRHEVPRHVHEMERHGRLRGDATSLIDECFGLVETNLTIVPLDVYVRIEPVARRRIPRDPTDWPTVALALVLEADIWTHDHDFLGCGVATWTTETLLAHLTS
jgi:predicted nucleic acid-binding protein